MATRTVLISGAGIAGPTLAYWLARNGFHPTVVERARGLRSSGSPVDVRGPAVSVAERMGVMPRLRDAGTRVTQLCFITDLGTRVGRIPLRQRDGAVELPRYDLAAILFEAARDAAEFVFDDSIATLHQDEGGVDVTFEHAPPRRFDLVIGADGLHSSTRRLAFGPDDDRVRHMGVWVATMPVPDQEFEPQTVFLYNVPGRAVSIHPGSGTPMAAFMYRAPADDGFDYRDMREHKRRLASFYGEVGWCTPELLDRVRTTDDLYLDSVSQVRLDRWSSGRVALLGDAASCVSLFGDGSSLAMAGAATLAEALAANPADHDAAFRGYEREHRRLVEPKQRGVKQAASVLIPASWAGIAARNAASRLWPLAAGAQAVGRALGRRRG